MTGKRWEPDRRPIREDETAYLKAAGEAVRELRNASGLTTPTLAGPAGISEKHLWRIIRGQRRTRRSTLARLVAVAVEANPDLDPPDLILDRLCALAGPALVLDTDGRVDLLSPVTAEELEALFNRWQRYENAARRARKRWVAADQRYTRLTGEIWIR